MEKRNSSDYQANSGGHHKDVKAMRPFSAPITFSAPCKNRLQTPFPSTASILNHSSSQPILITLIPGFWACLLYLLWPTALASQVDKPARGRAERKLAQGAVNELKNHRPRHDFCFFTRVCSFLGAISSTLRATERRM